jgi:hypothetical protein
MVGLVDNESKQSLREQQQWNIIATMLYSNPLAEPPHLPTRQSERETFICIM